VPLANAPVDASGDQVVLSAGALRLTVVTVGGGMRELIVGDWHVLDGYGRDEIAPGGAGQVLAPWPNRLAEGRYEFEGVSYQLPLTEPSKGNALHGFARWERWTLENRDATSAVLGVILAPRAGYPFSLELEVKYNVTPSSVGVEIRGRNVGRRALPYANGFHPYFSIGTPQIDHALLEVPSRVSLTMDDRQIPTGRSAVDGTVHDFTRARPIGPARPDTAYTDLVRGRDGMARVRLSDPTGSPSVAVRLGAAYTHVMAFTGDTLSDEHRRRRSLAIEPMTAAPNAFQSGDGLMVLAPGETHVAEWGIEVAPLGKS
jgi:aldose 1-epimerase